MAAMNGTATVRVKLTINVEDDLKALLVAQGWTPPGEQPHLEADQRRTLAMRDDAARVVRREHEKIVTDLKDQHAKELRAVRLRTSSDIRAEVAEEIARDLEKPRAWRTSPEDPAPWAKVARAHASKTTPFPLDAFKVYWTPACNHDDAFHTALGCTVAGCGCKEPRRQ